MHLTVVPIYHPEERKLYWNFSVLNSSFLDDRFLDHLSTVWTASDSYTLQYAFDKKKGFSRKVSEDHFRNEGHYKIEV